jgi:F-type H+-transporting ATPase subunit gamma
MAKSRELKRRIKAVGNIKRITKTMQMIATAKFQAALKRATAAKPYTAGIAQLVSELASSAAAAGTFSHPLIERPNPPVGKSLVLVVSSNRGLCGGYNANVLRTSTSKIKEIGFDASRIEVVGKKGVAYFKFLNKPISEFHSAVGDAATFPQAQAIADRFMKEYSEGKYDAVYVVYMSFVSASKQTPKVVQLLPLSNPAAEAGEAKAATANVQYEYSPSADKILGGLLPVTVRAQLFQALNEAAVSENIARMVAMKSATDAAGKMGKALSRKYNRARQAAITTELSEIIAGAASLG